MKYCATIVERSKAWTTRLTVRHQICSNPLYDRKDIIPDTSEIIKEIGSLPTGGGRIEGL